MRRVFVIANPTAGRRRRKLLRQVLGNLEGHGCRVKLFKTTAPGDAGQAASEIISAEYDAIVAAGGDGTVHETANGLTPDSPPLGIVPMGTANVFASEIGLCGDAHEIAATIATGTARDVYPGIIDGRLFLQMAGVGFDAAVVATVDLGLKRRIGKGAYIWRLLSMLPGYDYAPFTLTIDGTPHEAVSAIVANGRFYAGRYVIAPGASLYEPVFQVCLFTKPGARAVLSYGAALTRNRLASHPDVTIIEGRDIDIEGAVGAPLQVDGDPGGTVPAKVSVSSTSICVLHPA